MCIHVQVVRMSVRLRQERKRVLNRVRGYSAWRSLAVSKEKSKQMTKNDQENDTVKTLGMPPSGFLRVILASQRHDLKPRFKAYTLSSAIYPGTSFPLLSLLSQVAYVMLFLYTQTQTFLNTHIHGLKHRLHSTMRAKPSLSYTRTHGQMDMVTRTAEKEWGFLGVMKLDART
jgi:hypothetical protein